MFMRKFPFIMMFALLVMLVAGQLFTSKQAGAQGDIAGQNAVFKAPFDHERIDSEKAAKMRAYFKNNGRRDRHEFTKFSRAELMAALESMPQTDSVKFIIGAFTDEDNGPGQERGKPVIMLQLWEQGKPIPGGHFSTYKYLQGAICPPPSGVCLLEQ